MTSGSFTPGYLVPGAISNTYLILKKIKVLSERMNEWVSLCYHNLWFRGGSSRSPQAREPESAVGEWRTGVGVYMKQIRSHLPMDFSTSYQGVFQGEACEALTMGSVFKEGPEMQSGKGVTF